MVLAPGSIDDKHAIKSLATSPPILLEICVQHLGSGVAHEFLNRYREIPLVEHMGKGVWGLVDWLLFG